MAGSKKKGKKFPSRKQWQQFFSILNKKEKNIFFFLAVLTAASALTLAIGLYYQKTIEQADNGGSYNEGIVGQPRFINPLFLSSQDADRDIVEVLFSGLMKYNGQGELVHDLTESYQLLDAGRTIEVILKNNLFWHDKTPLTADDVVFTVNLVQEPQSQSSLRIKWMGIAVEKVSSSTVRFKLPKKYSGFLETLTLKILPKHIFKEIAPKDLAWELMSQKYLLGSGPFRFKKIEQDKTGSLKKLTLQRNELYYGKKPFLKEISFVFYQTAEDLLKGARIGEIDGFSLADPKNAQKTENGFQSFALAIPRYFALFFNLQSDTIFIEKELREALALAINKEEIIENVFLGKASQARSPILAQFFGFATAETTYSFDQTAAEQTLEELGFVLNPETGIREKKEAQQADFTFTKNLTLKSQGNEVTELQKCLARDPEVYPEAITSGYYGSKTKAAVIRFQEKYADDILKPIGLSKGTGDVKPMTRKKLNEVCFNRPLKTVPLQITLTTSNKFPLEQVAEVLKDNWQAIGAEVILDKVSLSDLQTNVLAKREFEILLFGEALGSIPDPFPFWHSSQLEYPGLNITGYKSKTADNYLEEAREASAEEERTANLEKFQNTLLKSLPAVFLVRPDYVYLLDDKVRGFAVEKITEPSKRFSTIEEWYVKTKRVWH